MAEIKFAKLKGRAREKGETIKTLASKIGISPASLSLKWNGRRMFTMSEMYSIKNILELDSIDEYFFSEKL